MRVTGAFEARRAPGSGCRPCLLLPAEDSDLRDRLATPPVREAGRRVAVAARAIGRHVIGGCAPGQANVHKPAPFRCRQQFITPVFPYASNRSRPVDLEPNIALTLPAEPCVPEPRPASATGCVTTECITINGDPCVTLTQTDACGRLARSRAIPVQRFSALGSSHQSRIPPPSTAQLPLRGAVAPSAAAW